MNKLLAALVAVVFLINVQSRGDAAVSTLKITSSAFAEGQPIPKRFTCDGANASPPLDWSGVPAGAKALALIVDDPDAPSGLFTHWIVVNLPPATKSLSEGGKTLPAGSGQGINDFGKNGYGGPCPPKGRHRYVFHLYATDALCPSSKPSRLQVDVFLRKHNVGQGSLTGTYQR
jgi:Raf kinase inhibitor-like YbhB/YbcL family protein